MEKNWARFGNYFQMRCSLCHVEPCRAATVYRHISRRDSCNVAQAGCTDCSERRPCRTCAYTGTGWKTTRALMTPRHAKRRFPRIGVEP